MGPVRGKATEGLAADLDLAAGHLLEEAWPDAGLLAQPPDPGLQAFGTHELVGHRSQAGVDLAGGRVGQQVGEAFTQDAAGTSAGSVGMVLATTLAADEDRLDTGAGGSNHELVDQPGQRPDGLATRAGAGW